MNTDPVPANLLRIWKFYTFVDKTFRIFILQTVFLTHLKNSKIFTITGSVFKLTSIATFREVEALIETLSVFLFRFQILIYSLIALSIQSLPFKNEFVFFVLYNKLLLSATIFNTQFWKKFHKNSYGRFAIIKLIFQIWNGFSSSLMYL